MRGCGIRNGVAAMTSSRLLSRTLACARAFARSGSGNVALYFGMAILPVFAVIGLAIDYANASRVQSDLQNSLDSAVLAGASTTIDKDREKAARLHFEALLLNDGLISADGKTDGYKSKFSVKGDTVIGEARLKVRTSFGALVFGSSIPVSINSQARFATPVGGPCINILDNASQALLLNSGADVTGTKCEIHVHSTKNPAFIMNAGVSLNIARLCVKGTKYIKNGGTLSKLETDCDVADDEWAGRIPEPALPKTCTTSGVQSGTTFNLAPGMHCDTIFNGSPTITFKPGLHIIKGRLIANAGAVIKADGVTFYFPDTDSEIRANGGLTFTGKAPTSGTYNGILMFEKTSDPANNAKKRQYVFNGSVSETIEGVIYLPNRDVTYNSKTNVTASKLSLTANTMIMNSANWKIEPYANVGAVTAAGASLID